jgi:Na+-driven multidrug efflux pump
MGFAIFVSGFFTALNDGVTSAIISFLRTLVFELGAILLLPLFFEVTGLWFAIVVAELMAAALSFFFMAIKRKRFIF